MRCATHVPPACPSGYSSIRACPCGRRDAQQCEETRQSASREVREIVAPQLPGGGFCSPFVLCCWTYDAGPTICLCLPAATAATPTDSSWSFPGRKACSAAREAAGGHVMGLTAALYDGASRLRLLETLVDSTLASLFAQQFIERKGDGERRERQSERRGSRCLEKENRREVTLQAPVWLGGCRRAQGSASGSLLHRCPEYTSPWRASRYRCRRRAVKKAASARCLWTMWTGRDAMEAAHPTSFPVLLPATPQSLPIGLRLSDRRPTDPGCRPSPSPQLCRRRRVRSAGAA